jgi:hypothetical protein
MDRQRGVNPSRGALAGYRRCGLASEQNTDIVTFTGTLKNDITCEQRADELTRVKYQISYR